MRLGLIGNCSGILTNGENAQFLDLFTTKSIGLNAPIEIRDLGWAVQQAYWVENPKLYEQYKSGYLKREGNNPPIFIDDNNAVGFANSGLQSTLTDAYKHVKVERSKGVDSWISASYLMQNEWELKQLMTLTKAHPAFDFIKYVVLNVSCPNTHAGETATLKLRDDVERTHEQIKDYVSIAKTIGKEVLVKFSLGDESTEFVETAVRAGAYGIVDGNTVPAAVHNSYTKEFFFYCGHSGPGVHQRMLKVVSDHNALRRDEGLDFVILSQGGNHDGPTALDAIKAGADLIGMGTVFKNKNMNQIKSIIDSTNEYLAKFDLDSLRGTETFENPSYWTDPNAWLMVNGQRKLITYSDSHKPNIVKSVTPVSADSVMIELEQSIGEYDLGQFFGLMYTKPGERPQERPLTAHDNHSFIVHDLRRHAELHKDDPKEAAKLLDPTYGLFTHAVATNFKPGQQVYVRGPVGKGLKLEGLGKILAVGGGCGAISLKELQRRSGCDVMLAFKDEGEVMLETIASKVHIDSESGGVLPVKDLPFSDYDSVVVCGPPTMMFPTAKEAVSQGVNPHQVKLLIEGMVKCFSGFAGCCTCNSKGHKVCLNPAPSYATLKEGGDFLVRGKHTGVIERYEL